MGEQLIVRDRNQHDVAVTVTAGSFSSFDIGKAFATVVAPSGTDTDARPITIGLLTMVGNYDFFAHGAALIFLP